MTPETLRSIWDRAWADESIYGQELITKLRELLDLLESPNRYLMHAVATCQKLDDVIPAINLVAQKEEVMKILTSMTYQLFPKYIEKGEEK